MSVELVPKAESGCFDIGLANGTWFALCDGPLKTIIGQQHTNDPIDVDAVDADLCGDALDQWEPPDDWFSPGKEAEGKAMMIAFFKTCKGFTTY